MNSFSSRILAIASLTLTSALAYQAVSAQQAGDEAPHIDEQREQAAEVPASAQPVPNGGRAWWEPGEGRPLETFVDYENDRGRVYHERSGSSKASHPIESCRHGSIWEALDAWAQRQRPVRLSSTPTIPHGCTWQLSRRATPRPSRAPP